MSSADYIYKIWDTFHRKYTVNQGRISNNPFHPGRVYINRFDVDKCLKLCDSFYGDLDHKEIHRFIIDEYEVVE